MTISGVPHRALLVALPAALAVTSLAALTTTTPAAAAVRWDALDLSLVTDSEGLAPVADCCGYSIQGFAGHGQHLAVAWSDLRPHDPYGTPDSDIEFRASHDGGTTWGTLLNLSHDDGKHSGGEVVAVGPDASVVAYTHEDPAGPLGSRPQVRRVEHTGQVTTVDVPDTVIGMTDIAYAGGDTYRILTREGVATYTDGAPSLTDPGQALPFSADWWLSFAAQGDLVALSASPRSYTTDTEATVAVSTDGGATFAEPIDLTDTPQRELNVQVATNNGIVVATWWTQFSESDSRLYAARSTDDGNTWSTPAVIATGQKFGQAMLSETPTGFALTTPGADGGIMTSIDGANWASAAGVPTPVPYGTELVVTAAGGYFLGGPPRVHRFFDDTLAPDVEFLTTPPKMTRDAKDALLSFSASDADSHTLDMECYLNGYAIGIEDLCYDSRDAYETGNDFYSELMPVTNTPVTFDLGRKAAVVIKENHRNTLRIVATDEVGNTSTAIYSWVIDRRAPAVTPGTLPERTNKKSVSWTVRAKDRLAGVKKVQIRFKVGDGAWKTPDAWSDLGATPTVTVRLAKGATTHVSARAVDKLGNTSDWTTPRTVTRP